METFLSKENINLVRLILFKCLLSFIGNEIRLVTKAEGHRIDEGHRMLEK